MAAGYYKPASVTGMQKLELISRPLMARAQDKDAFKALLFPGYNNESSGVNNITLQEEKRGKE